MFYNNLTVNNCKNNLVSVHEGQIVTTSIKLASYFNKRHCDIIRAINNMNCSNEFKERNFAYCLKINELKIGTTRQPFYYMTRDGFTFLAMGFTGKIAAQFKEAYINAFNEMEEKLKSANVLPPVPKKEEIEKYKNSQLSKPDKEIACLVQRISQKYNMSAMASCIEDVIIAYNDLIALGNGNYDKQKYNNTVTALREAWLLFAGAAFEKKYRK